MPLEVIGAGFGRTGTNSLKLALEALGFGPCHHMYELSDHPGQLDFWEAAARGDPVDWEEGFRGYRAQVDWPGAFHWRALAEAYPRARVILSVRDPAAWYASFSRTIAPLITARGQRATPFLNRLTEMNHATLTQATFGGRLDDAAQMIARFNGHNAEVRATIPPGRLLSFDVREGWAPLCAFLGVPVPQTAFPRTNDASEFHQKRHSRAGEDPRAPRIKEMRGR